MKKTPSLNNKTVAALVSALLCAGSAGAEDVFVTAYLNTTSGSANNTPCPPSCADGLVSASGSSSYSLAVPQPPISPRRSRFGYGDGCSWSVTPDDYSASGSTYGTAPLTSPGVYRIYVTLPTLGSCSPDIVANMTATGGDLAGPAGIGAATVPVYAFQSTNTAHTWILVGYITNNVPNPTVTFTWVSGGLTSSIRWYMDAVRFEALDPCTGVAPQTGVDGPLAAGQTFVNVTGVSTGATNVTVYADNVEIGQTNYSAGFAAGAVTVPTSSLVKNSKITSRQIKNGCEGVPPGSGPAVGGGPNPLVRAMVACWKSPGFAGPIGENTTANLTNSYFLGATGLTSGFGTAPTGGRELLPDQCWQTVSFNQQTEDSIYATSGNHVTNSDPYCALEGLVFSIVEMDSGPYDIYVDTIMNGDVVIEDFEGYTNGATATFTAPNQASTPTAAATYLSAPNSSRVRQNYAFDGTNSLRIRWQFADTNAIRWAHVLANAAVGKHYPQIDTTKPISLRYLVLPVGVTTDHKFNGTVSEISGAAPAYATGSNNLSVSVTGPAAYTYQWSLNGVELFDATTSSYGIGTFGLSIFDNGTYSVAVSDGVCTETRNVVVNVVDPLPTVTNQPAHKVMNVGQSGAAMTVGATGHVPGGYPLYYTWRFNGMDLFDQTTETLTINNAQIANVGAYEVVVANFYGSVTSIVQTLDVVPAGITAGTGTGLRGEYWSTRYSTNAFSGPPTVTRVDPIVDFGWGTDAPAPEVSPNYFSARWTGQIQALGTDTYTLYTISDDGIRLWIDGQPVIQNWSNHAPTTNSTVLALAQTDKYDLQLEFYENASGAVAKLYWSTASGSVGFEPVPMSQLYPAALSIVPTFNYSLNNGTNLVFNWGAGAYTLAWSTNVAGPYTNLIYGVTSPYTVTIDSAPAKFYRLQVQ